MSVLVRSPSSPWRRRFLGGLVFALVAAATACGGIGITAETEDGTGTGSTGTTADSGATDPTAIFDAGASPPDVSETPVNGGDAGAGPADTQPYISPLCGATTACDPDLVSGNGCGGSEQDAGAVHGVDAGGTLSGDGSAAAMACRVSTTGKPSTATVPLAACVAAGPGTDGSACAGGDDCSVGYECVGSPGQCRRYCCSGACSEDKTFCDLQPASGADAIVVPVCMPVDPCKLLESGSCPPSSTCAVVADDGGTSCVAIGTAGEGDDCDTVHCMANEICVGKSGSRVCDKLCDVDGGDCSAGKTCTTNATLFEEDESVGVCTAPQ